MANNKFSDRTQYVKNPLDGIKQIITADSAGSLIKITGNTAQALNTTASGMAFNDQFFSKLGAVGTPTYSFDGDTNTGMWSSGADILNFSTGGTERVEIDSTSMTVEVPLFVDVIEDKAGTDGPTFTHGFTNSNLDFVSDTLGTLFTATVVDAVYHDAANFKISLGEGTWLINWTSALNIFPNDGSTVKNIFGHTELLIDTNGEGFDSSATTRSGHANTTAFTQMFLLDNLLAGTGAAVTRYVVQPTASTVHTVPAGTTDIFTIGLTCRNISSSNTVIMEATAGFSGVITSDTRIWAVRLSN